MSSSGEWKNSQPLSCGTCIKVKETKSPEFCIICEPLNSSAGVVSNLASIRYQDHFALIMYDDNIDDDRKRVLIEHELGYLFIAVSGNRELISKHEPLSSIFGTLIMLHKKAPFNIPANELKLVDECISIMKKLSK